MQGFQERFPDLVQLNPGGPQDPLGESVLDHRQPWLRIFEAQDRRIVLGRNQDPHRELRLDAVAADQVPIHRRVSGGGTVVLAPGSLVVALRLRQVDRPIDAWFQLINKAFIAALAACGVKQAACYGHGDLALSTDDGKARKILGASLRQTRDAVYYLGVFLIDDLVPLMERYLQSPSRAPDYREGRNHADFCTNLAACGIASEQLSAALADHVNSILRDQALLD